MCATVTPVGSSMCSAWERRECGRTVAPPTSRSASLPARAARPKPGWRLPSAGCLPDRPTRGCVAAFPADLPSGDHQMTLAVELTLAARWSSARRQAEIDAVLSQLDQAGISYTLIQVEAGELVYLPKNTPGT